MNPGRFTHRALLSAGLGWVMLSFTGAPLAAAEAEQQVDSPAVPLEKLLRPDGSLDLHGYRGSVNAAGWRMSEGANGAPRFVRERTNVGSVDDAVEPVTTSSLDYCWDDRFAIGTNYFVFALAVDGSGNLYAGGQFTSAGGASANRIAKWNGTSWSALGTGTNGPVRALAFDGSGNLYAGGEFTTAGGASANRIAKWNGTSWSALGVGMNNTVYALALDSGGSNLYAGGVFTMAGGASALHVARWNGVSWSALGTGTNNSVVALAVDCCENLYAGGSFTMAGGVSANRIAKWNGSWSAMGAGMNNNVNALAVDGSGNLYAGGHFTGLGRNYIAKFNGTSWSALGTGTNGPVYALAIDGSGNLYAGGEFTTADGASASRIAKWNGTSWSGLGNGIEAAVLALAAYGSGNLYAGGFSTTAGNKSANYVAKWDGTSWSALGGGMNSAVHALAAYGSGNLYAGGSFTSAGNSSANYVAKWNGTSWSALGTGMNNWVLALAVDGNGNLYAGGYFTTAGGVSANYVANWNGTNWSALGTGMSTEVHALAVDGSGNLYAGGYFTTAGGVSANRIAKWNGTSWSALGTGMSNPVAALAVDGSGNLYAGGSFTTAGGVSANRIAKWNGTSWSALGTGMDSAVVALAVDGSGNLYAGGSFSTAGGASANRIAKWNGTSWSALGTGMNNPVDALAVDGSTTLYAGGDFTTAGGVSANRIAKWDGTSWSALGTGMDNFVGALAVDGSGILYAGGNFTTAGGTASEYFAGGNPKYYLDADGDGYGNPGVGDCITPAPAGYVTNNWDCDDTDPAVHPGVPDQTCNGIDDDCDGVVDDGVSGCACVQNAPGLLGWWRGNGNADDAASGNHGSLANGATASAAGRVGQAFTLDGVDDHVANLGDAYSYAFIENTGVFTINAWINLNVFDLRDQPITANTDSTIEKGHFFNWTNDVGEQRLRIVLMQSIEALPVIDSQSPMGVITTNGWHHVAVVGNGTTIKFYVDGVGYPGTGTMTSKPSGPSTRSLNIGRGAYNNRDWMFAGQIDEVQIHDRALSAFEIGAIYNAAGNGMCGTGCAQGVAGLAGWWPGSGDAGDRSAFNNHGALTGGVTFTDGRVGKAFALPVDPPMYVEIPDRPSLEMTSQLTLATWVRPDHAALNNSARIISKGLAYELLFDTNNNLHPRGGISSDGNNSDVLVSPASLSVGTWAHVAMTFDAGAWKLYVDGNEIASKVSAMTSIYSAGNSKLCLGSYPTGSNRLVGAIDEPMVFNQALSEAEVMALYQAGASGLCGLGLVVSVEEPTGPTGSLAFSTPWPNPSTRLIQMRMQLPAEALVRAEVFDIAGRRVRSLIDEQRLPAGEHRLIWDGRDPSGRRVAAGVYQIRVRAGEALAVRRIVMIR